MILGDIDKVNRTPDSTLINGLGRYTGGPTDAPLAVISGQSGKRYVSLSIQLDLLVHFVCF